MKTRTEVSNEKLRGGFYTPELLVQRCLDHVERLLPVGEVRLLEPSAGDGAFVRGLARHPLADRVEHITAIEPEPEEAHKCRGELDAAGVDHQVVVSSCISWATSVGTMFDAAVGNPPFVRFQFVPEADRLSTAVLGSQLSLSFKGVSNLWIPVLLSSLSRVRSGGAFAFVVPSECFTGISAGVAREWLLTSAESIELELFPPGSFPGVLQEIVILSGRRRSTTAASTTLTIREVSGEVERAWTHEVPADKQSWTRYLLTPEHLAALKAAESLPVTNRLGSIARFEVATVTGANEFFSVPSSVVEQFDLAPWALPLLPRIRHADGLIYGADDHRTTLATGARGHLLSFSESAPDPNEFAAAVRYLEAGLRDGLADRYKCRIRRPWYRVPVVPAGTLLLSKRSHRYPRVVVNAAGVVTTDTIYRGTMVNGTRPEAVAASFHNSLTLLSAELEGRSFGGGVLELVPSEVSRLLVPLIPGFEAELDRLDQLARETGDSELLIEETDLLLGKSSCGLNADLMAVLSEARLSLLSRRLDRNRTS